MNDPQISIASQKRGDFPDDAFEIAVAATRPPPLEDIEDDRLLAAATFGCAIPTVKASPPAPPEESGGGDVVVAALWRDLVAARHGHGIDHALDKNDSMSSRNSAPYSAVAALGSVAYASSMTAASSVGFIAAVGACHTSTGSFSLPKWARCASYNARASRTDLRWRRAATRGWSPCSA